MRHGDLERDFLRFRAGHEPVRLDLRDERMASAKPGGGVETSGTAARARAGRRAKG